MFRRAFSAILIRVFIGTTAVVSQGNTEAPKQQTSFVDLRGVLANEIPIGTRLKDPGNANGVIGHHTATNAWSFSRVADLHAYNNKWGIISYDLGVNYLGQKYLLKSPGILGYHSSGWNRDSFAVVLLGNFSTKETPPVMRQGFDECLQYLFDTYGLHYFMMHSTAKWIRDQKVTECPGTFNHTWLAGYEFDDRSIIPTLPAQPATEFRLVYE